LKLRSYEHATRVIKYRIIQTISYIKGLLEIEEIPTYDIVVEAREKYESLKRAFQELVDGVVKYFNLKDQLEKMGIESLPIDRKYYYSTKTSYVPERGKPTWLKEEL